MSELDIYIQYVVGDTNCYRVIINGNVDSHFKKLSKAEKFVKQMREELAPFDKDLRYRP